MRGFKLYERCRPSGVGLCEGCPVVRGVSGCGRGAGLCEGCRPSGCARGVGLCEECRVVRGVSGCVRGVGFCEGCLVV